MGNLGRQDKESGQNPLSMDFCSTKVGKSGKPAFGGCAYATKEIMKRKETEKCSDRHVRITDISLLEQFDEIMQHPRYHSFNKVLNEALFYGLPMLHDQLFGEVTLPPETPTVRPESTQGSLVDNEAMRTVIRLLKEIVLNEVINKSMLSSIFNATALGLNGEEVSGEKFEQGYYSSTPEYLEDFELRGLKSLRQ